MLNWLDGGGPWGGHQIFQEFHETAVPYSFGNYGPIPVHQPCNMLSSLEAYDHEVTSAAAASPWRASSRCFVPAGSKRTARQISCAAHTLNDAPACTRFLRGVNERLLRASRGKVGKAGAAAEFNAAMAMLAWGSMMFHSANIDVGRFPDRSL